MSNSTLHEGVESVELRDVPRGYPLDMLVREEARILRQTKALGVYARALLSAGYTVRLKNGLRISNLR